MNIELTRTFTPTYQDGGLDRRYAEDLITIFKATGTEALEGLQEFRSRTTKLENDYGKYAYILCLSFYKRIAHINATERDETNQWKWRSKGLLKQLREGLQELGFKKENVSKLIGAAEYESSIELNMFHEKTGKFKPSIKKELDWFQSFPISSRYILTLMSEEGRAKAKSYASDTTAWDSKTDTYVSKPLTKRVLEDIKSSYPKNQDGRGGGGRAKKDLRPCSDDPYSIDEELIEGQVQIQEKFLYYLERLDMEDAFVNQEFRDSLNRNSNTVEILKSWLSNRIKPTLSTIH